ncbi:hypothetical protein BKP37_01825 [Anaerobacillus alkalilacustris]|uniref:Uncharacterized protein n=1 Tax=Anaerobacillus alkalilacustris TaxID=393763 RepID=A0A1S2LY35_9BACI|nr:hypothetical protein [Anaerobacillus alkalilacustris]OIJ17266.1 hypothetical protein BKP37_01825 [Anaerobacillus alkalilacustris]
MFDPTIYENLKVVLEGKIYERDFNNEIIIVDRQDNIDLASMSRQYVITFSIKSGSKNYQAKVKLKADSKDLYGEILEKETISNCGCHLMLSLNGPLTNISSNPQIIKQMLENKWNKRPIITQEIYYTWNPNEAHQYFLKTILSFDRKINEDHIDDFDQIMNLLIESLLLVEKINTNP